MKIPRLIKISLKINRGIFIQICNFYEPKEQLKSQFHFC